MNIEMEKGGNTLGYEQKKAATLGDPSVPGMNVS